MKLQIKLFSILAPFFLIIAVSSVIISIYILINNQRKSTNIFKDEFVSVFREYAEGRSSVMFKLLEQRVNKITAPNSKSLTALVEDIGISELAVFDHSGRLLALSPENKNILERLLTEDALSVKIRSELITGKVSFKIDNINNFLDDGTNTIVPVIVNFRVIENPPLIFSHIAVTQIVPTRIRFIERINRKDVSTYITVSVAFFFALGMVSFILIVITMRKFILLPIGKIAGLFHEVSAGNYNQRIELSNHDEIGDLANAFNIMTGTIQDTLGKLEDEIRERKKAEELLEREKEELRITLKSIGDGVVTTDQSGNVVLLNNVAEKLSGWTQEEAAGKNIQEILHIVNQMTHEPVENPVIRVLAEGKMTGVDNYTALISRSGQEIIIDDSAAPILQQDRIIGVVFVFRNVTEQRKMEQQLIQSQKLDAIGTLAGGIAHDFNNILFGIFGFTELSLSALDKPQTVKEYLRQVLSSAERARELVNQILTFSRSSEIELKPITPKYIIKEALKLLRASIPATVDFRTMINSNSSILGDPTQLHQVIVNLYTNAAYAMKNKTGMIEVTLEDLDVDEDFARLHPGLLPGNHIMLRISDTGSGIKPEILSRIFEPFFTTKPLGEGTGLGLSVVHGIIKKISGIITVYTEAGKGTTFSIIIPALTTEASEIINEQNGDIPGGTERIMLIDDENIILNAIRLILINLGYKTFSFSSSISAFEAFQNDPQGYDLILTDYTMPNLTGIDLAVKIKSIRKDTAIILYSGFMHKGIEEAALTAGISELLRKPVSTRELAAAIRRALDK